MDPEFQRILARVFLVGGVIGIASAAVLVFAFRAFGGKTEIRAVVLIIAVLALVFLGCAVLLLFSVPQQG